MANPAIARFSVLLHIFLISQLVNTTISVDSPSPAPNSPAATPSPSPSHISPVPNPSPASSPQAPTPAQTPLPNSPPAPTPDSTSSSPSPSPSPADADDGGFNHSGVGNMEVKSSGGGMSSGKKAGIAVGVIAAAGVVALGALVFKKRRQNIERAEYGYAARRELL